MKKKIIYTILLSFMVAAVSIGCGKSKEQKKVEKELKEEFGDDLDDEEIEELAEFFVDDEEETEQVSEEEAFNKMYPLSEEWSTTTAADYAFQVDDVFLKYGMKLSDVMDLFASAEGEYYLDEYNPDFLVSPEERHDLYIKKNGEQYMVISGFNVSRDETKALKDTVLSGFVSQKPCLGHIALAGKSAEELSKMSLDEVKALITSYYDEDNFKFDFETYNNDEYINLQVSNIIISKDRQTNFPNIEWTGVEYYPFYHAIWFTIDRNTNTCTVSP